MNRRYWYFTLLLVYSQFVNGSWVQKQNFGGMARYGAVGFSIGNLGYAGTGLYHDDFWQYDPILDTWTQKANFPGGNRHSACGFSTSGKGYMGLGIGPAPSYPLMNDFWEYDPVANNWIIKASYPGSGRYAMTSLAIGSRGYIGMGTSGPSGPFQTDMYEFDPSANTWIQKSSFPGPPRCGAAGFSIGLSGYIGMGVNVVVNTTYNDLFLYDPVSDTWTPKANFPGTPRSNFASFTIGANGYLGTGCNFNTNTVYNDFWKYEPISNSWNQVTSLPSTVRWSPFVFSINGEGYLGAGRSSTSAMNNLTDFWKFSPNDPIGISELSNSPACILYPNPVHSLGVISTNVQFSNATVSVYSCSGKRVYQIEEHYGKTIQLSGSNLTAGVYLVKIEQPGIDAISLKMTVKD